MRSVAYSMGVSLDGYIAGPGGDITDHQRRQAARKGPLPTVVLLPS